MEELKVSEPESWLLRLFESIFFDSRLAVAYLFRYRQSVGIQHYICKALLNFPEDDIEFLLPQLCHILISRPDECKALEDFMIGLCGTSHHMAVLMIWYLEAYLNERHQAVETQTEAYQYCKRLCVTCQTIIFAEKEVMNELVEVDVHRSAHIPPGIIGFGLILASVGAPIAYESGLELVRSQAKQARFFNPLDDEENEDEVKKVNRKSLLERIMARIPRSSPSLDELSKGSAFSFKNYIKKTKLRLVSRQRSLSADIVSDKIGSPVDIPKSTSMNLLSSLDADDLEGSHYFHAELQFIMTLVDISKRLVSVPKSARQASLIAELSLLNHNLPANVCLPFWCPGEGSMRNHHQVVRIALSDCVVLNSADRVPYLMLVEVLETGCKSERKSSFHIGPSVEFVGGVEHHNKDAAEYYKKVLSRRQSVVDKSNSASNIVEEIALEEVVLEEDEVVYLGAIPGEVEFAEKMRTAAVLLAQLYLKKPLLLDVKAGQAFELIRNKVLKEMSASEDQRIKSKNIAIDELLPVLKEQELQRDVEDPSASVFREKWDEKRKRIQNASPFGRELNWQLYAVIVKSGADLRQEQLALQLITEIQHSWQAFQVPVWVYSFRILITSDQSGLIEVIPDSVSIHSIKKSGYSKKLNQPGIQFSLYDHFIAEFGEPGKEPFQVAQDNFVKSLAGYSIISYLLQIKDRHNGNILLDRQGHLTHIDFGFMLMNSPGSVGFELAPFKLPQEYIDVLGGVESEKFDEYRELVKLGFLALRKRSESIIGLVEIMERDSRLPCFTGVNKAGQATNVKYSVTQGLRDRMQLGMTDDQFSIYVDGLIDSSCNNLFTSLYDTFQYYANGIL